MLVCQFFILLVWQQLKLPCCTAWTGLFDNVVHWCEWKERVWGSASRELAASTELMEHDSSDKDDVKDSGSRVAMLRERAGVLRELLDKEQSLIDTLQQV